MAGESESRARVSPPPQRGGSYSEVSGAADGYLPWISAQQILDSLHEAESFGPPDLDAGRCEECQSDARHRYRLGRFALCRACRSLRARVAVKVSEDSYTLPEPPTGTVSATADRAGTEAHPARQVQAFGAGKMLPGVGPPNEAPSPAPDLLDDLYPPLRELPF
jgi:hypothetical protein